MACCSLVENYRKLQRISKPQFEDVRIGDLVADLQHLYPDSIFHYEIENEDQRLLMDRSQIEQVLINLLKNAQEAVENRVKDEAADLSDEVESAQNQIPYVRLTTHLSSNKRDFIISITDNGKGILPEVMERIFCAVLYYQDERFGHRVEYLQADSNLTWWNHHRLFETRR